MKNPDKTANLKINKADFSYESHKTSKTRQKATQDSHSQL